MLLALLLGKLTGNPEGVTKEDVNIKNTSNRNIKSVMEDILKFGSILFFELRFIDLKTAIVLSWFLKQVNKINGRIFHLVDNLLHP